MLHRFRLRRILPVAICLCLHAHEAVGWSGPSAGVIPNLGQVGEPVRYYAHCDEVSLYFTDTGVVFDLVQRGHAVWMQFEGARPPARIEPAGPRASRLHYFLGGDPERWHPGIQPYDELIYRGLWPGIDLCLRPGGGEMAYEIVSHPGADPRRARFVFEGVDRIQTTEDGSLRLEIPFGVLIDRPVDSDGTRRVLSWQAGSALDEEGDPYGRDDPGTVDWSTLMGGTDNEYAHGLTLDEVGNPVVAGYTRSGNFPTTPGAYDRTNAGSYDVFVAKIHHTGSFLIWATFLGGEAEDRSFGVHLDASGQPVVGGLTYSSNFPTTVGAYDRILGGQRDAFVAKLNSSGSDLLWSTYLGGSAFDRIWDVVLDDEDRPVVVGETFSSDFPVTPGAYDTVFGGASDGFAAKLDALGESLVWSTYLGGGSSDQVTFLAVGPEQRLSMTGNTLSSDFPTTPGAFDATHNGGQDSFVTSLDSSDGALYASTFLGGGGAEYGNIIDVDATGTAVVAGSTTSSDFPTTAGAFDTSHNGDRDLFVARVDAAGETLMWGTYLGGSGTDEPFALVLDAIGGPILSGTVFSSDYPTTTGAFDRSYAGNGDAFLTRLDPSGSALLWSSFLGGTESEGGWELVLDSSGNPVLTGPTRSPDFPTTDGAYDRTYGGANDVFLVRFDIADVNAVEETAGLMSPPRFEPNPFRDAVRIDLDLPESSEVRVLVLDATGRRIANVHRGLRSAGTHRISWDGRDAKGRPVACGPYWIKVETDRSATHHLVVRAR